MEGITACTILVTIVNLSFPFIVPAPDIAKDWPNSASSPPFVYLTGGILASSQTSFNI